MVLWYPVLYIAAHVPYRCIISSKNSEKGGDWKSKYNSLLGKYRNRKEKKYKRGHRTVYSVQYSLHCTLQCTVYSVQYSVQCTGQCTVYSTVYSVQYTVLGSDTQKCIV
jgi:hypothetical protein